MKFIEQIMADVRWQMADDNGGLLGHDSVTDIFNILSSWRQQMLSTLLVTEQRTEEFLYPELLRG